MPKCVEMRGIVKQYPLVRAVDHVDFSVHCGEIHSLLGENGAGKTCLMRILYGMTMPDEGRILIDGKETVFHSPKDAIKNGIGMVHQHFLLSPVMTVTENIIVGKEPVTEHHLLDMDDACGKVQKLIDTYHFGIDARAKVQSLSVGEQQRVEILKAIWRGAQILILDEPTAVLTPQEVDELFLIMRRLKTAGTGIVIITHKLKETLAIADTISVLRSGKMIRHRQSLGGVTMEELATMMVGREVELNVHSDKKPTGKPYFSVKHCTLSDHGIQVLKDISFSIRRGEILGIAGVEGNGQSELAEVLTGLRKPDRGEMYKGEERVEGDAKTMIHKKIGHIPEDRLVRGLITEMSVATNIILGYHDDRRFVRHGFLDGKAIVAYANTMINEYQIKTPNARARVSSLSGGNQQKIVVARVISQDPDVLVVCQPTRGVDVGAMEYIHHRILDLKERGKAVVLISADLDEVMNLSDRIAVMYEGRIVAIKDKDDVTFDELGLLMTGGADHA
ncbi:MAG: ABC transporter ATP-binding protein [Sphaerochaetaceae bacterium]